MTNHIVLGQIEYVQEPAGGWCVDEEWGCWDANANSKLRVSGSGE